MKTKQSGHCAVKSWKTCLTLEVIEKPAVTGNVPASFNVLTTEQHSHNPLYVLHKWYWIHQ